MTPNRTCPPVVLPCYPCSESTAVKTTGIEGIESDCSRPATRDCCPCPVNAGCFQPRHCHADCNKQHRHGQPQRHGSCHRGRSSTYDPPRGREDGDHGRIVVQTSSRRKARASSGASYSCKIAYVDQVTPCSHCCTLRRVAFVDAFV